MKNLFKYHRQIRNIDPDLIQTVKTEIRKVPTRFKVCGRSALQTDSKKLSEIDLLNNKDIMQSKNLDLKIVE